MTGSLKRLAESLWYVRSRHRLLNVPIPVRLPYGGWFLAYGDAIGARIAGYRLAGSPYEQAQWRLVKRILTPGGGFVDVGANQGFYTILASRLVGAAGSVFAFEPASTEVGKLRRNLRWNGCRNVVVEAMAVGAEVGRAEFHLYTGHQGSWSGLREGAADVVTEALLVEVPTTSLDAYFSGRPPERIDMIKIDVEGGELHVLEGARGLISRFRPVVLCEVESRRTRQWGYEAEAIIARLEGWGYRWRTVKPDGKLGAPPKVADEWQNLAAIPEERLGDLTAS